MGEHQLDKLGVTGSSPVPPTSTKAPQPRGFLVEDLGHRGIKLLPMYAGFNPADERLEPIWKYAEKHRLPQLHRRLRDDAGT